MQSAKAPQAGGCVCHTSRRGAIGPWDYVNLYALPSGDDFCRNKFCLTVAPAASMDPTKDPIVAPAIQLPCQLDQILGFQSFGWMVE